MASTCFLLLAVSFLFLADIKACQVQPPSSMVQQVERNLVLTGIFPLTYGTNCSEPYLSGAVLLHSAMWTINTLNVAGFFPNSTKLSLETWDTCSTRAGSTRAVVSAAANLLSGKESCTTMLQAGMISSFDTPDLISQIADNLNVPFARLPQANMDTEIIAGIDTLQKLNWANVAVIAETNYQLERFGNLAAESGVCVVNQFLFPSVPTIDNYIRLLKRLQKSGAKTTVLMGQREALKKALEAAEKESMSQPDWMLLSTQELKEMDFLGYPTVAPGLIALYPKLTGLPEIQDIKNTSVSEAIGVYDILTTIRSVFGLSQQLRRFTSDRCGDSMSSCKFDTFKYRDVSADDMSDLDKILGLRTSADGIVISAVSESLSLREIGNGDSMLSDINAMAVIPKSNDTENRSIIDCYACLCTNMDRSFLESVVLKEEMWVFVSITVTSLGILTTIAICVFIFVRMWNADSIEGSQGFTILILVANIILYSSVFTYVIPVSELLCWMRTPATVLSYALLFSLMTARSIMLATSDTAAVSGHISGYVQSILFLLMFGVQVAMTVTDLLYSHRSHSVKFVTDSGPKIMCRSDWVSDTISYSYVLLLILILIVTTPFSTRSKRNYHEGPSFCISTYLTVIVWVVWVSGYFLLDKRWNDSCVVAGTIGTATIQLLAVFIPKTYMMATSIAADAVSVTMRESNFLPERPNSRPVYETIQVPTNNHYGIEPTRSTYMHYSDPASPKKSEF